MTRLIRWLPDDQSAAILAAYARRREPLRHVLRRALKLLATADGLLNTRGHVNTQPGHRRKPS